MVCPYWEKIENITSELNRQFKIGAASKNKTCTYESHVRNSTSNSHYITTRVNIK